MCLCVLRIFLGDRKNSGNVIHELTREGKISSTDLKVDLEGIKSNGISTIRSNMDIKVEIYNLCHSIHLFNKSSILATLHFYTSL